MTDHRHDRHEPEPLEQPQPAVVRSRVGARDVTQVARVVARSPHTLVVEFDDPAAALAVTLAATVEVDIDDGVGLSTIVATPGSRLDDNPTSRQVEMVIRPA